VIGVLYSAVSFSCQVAMHVHIWEATLRMLWWLPAASCLCLCATVVKSNR